MGVNTQYTLIAFAGVLVIIIAYIVYARGGKEVIYGNKFASITDVLEAVKTYMVELSKDDFSLSYSEEEFNKMHARQANIQNALKTCVYGIDDKKSIVIGLIRDYIDENVEESSIVKMLGLDGESEPSDHIVFEILMYRYKKRYGKDALAKWIDKNNFARERIATGSNRIQDKAYYITVDDLQQSYLDEDIHLSMDEMKDVLAVLVYQIYKGFGIIDTLREMNINGFNMGTSGSILSLNNSRGSDVIKANNSVWLYYKGRYIHLRFMNFGNEDELKRMIQLLIRYNNPGPLTAKRGYLVNTMYDKSRILALRPPASEYWAIFIRKFTLSDVSAEALIIKDYTHKGELAVKLIEMLIRGQVTCAVTGRQGSGKTTLMTALIAYIDPRFTIRVLEMAPELYLREIYYGRNILSVQETLTVSAAELQDALKKSDAAVSIVGEVATDAIAARMIQMGMTASLFTIFSHHANSPKDLVLTLRNSLVNDGGFSNMETAEKQVTDVVKFDIHLDYTPSGKRYISKISEIIQLDSNIPYPEYDSNDPVNSMNIINREYYHRRTDRISFTWRTIMHYDLDTDTYICDQRISAPMEDRILATIDPEIRDEFKKFIYDNWGVRPADDDYKENLFVDEAVLNKMKSDVQVKMPSRPDGVDDSLVEDNLVMNEIASIDDQLADEFSIGLFDD